MAQIDEIARELGTSGRTLRRAASRGTIWHTRPSPRRFVLDAREREYLRTRWKLLSRMLGVFRTRPDVTLAVLYGSTSRGDDRPSSDVDLLVQLERPSMRALSSLTDRLEEELGRRVHLVELESAEESPLLLFEILRDGRVLADRASAWNRLKQHEHAIADAAAKESEQAADELVAAFAELFV